MERYSTPINEETVYAMFSPFFRDEPLPEPVQAPPINGARNGARKSNFDAISFLNAHGVRILKQEPHQGGTKLVLEHCIFDESHRGKDAAVFIGSDGKLGYKCFHNSCAGKTWKDVRRRLDPGCYDRRSDAQPPPADVPLAEPYQPFPLDALPPVMGRYVGEAAAAIGCDAAYIALPVLACLGRAIGNKRTVRLKRTWSEPAVIWGAIIGKSGTHKTPAIQAATAILQARQGEAIEAHKETAAQHERDKALYDRAYAEWRKSKKTTEPPPSEPEPPALLRYIVSDITIEALADRLHRQYDGVLVVRDELAGWLGGIAEYKGGRGSDLGHWQAAWSAAPLTVDRKTGDVKTIHVPRAAVSLVGGIQPGVLKAALGREHLQDGLCARLLLAMPDAKPVRWSDDTIAPTTEAAMEKVYDRLFTLAPAVDAEGKPEPLALPLTTEAKELWIAYVNRHGEEMGGLDDDLAAAWSKLKAYAARFSLILQLVAWAAGDGDDKAVDLQAMRCAIALADWFGGEAKRVYQLFTESVSDTETRETLDLIRRLGGSITANNLRRRSRRFTTSDAAEKELNRLVRAGAGRWESSDTPQGGRPTRYFIVLDV